MSLRPLLFLSGMGVVTLVIIKILFQVMTPFVLGLFIACLIDPLVNIVECRFGWRRAFAAVVVMTGATFGCAAFLLLILNGLYVESHSFFQQLPRISRQGAEFLQYLSQVFARYQRSVPPEIQREIIRLIDNSLSTVSGLLVGLLKSLEQLPRAVGTSVLAVVSAFFFTRDKAMMKAAVLRFVPERWQPLAQKASHDLFQAVIGRIRLESALMGCTFLVTGLVLSTAGLPRAWTIGMVAAILELLPLVGPGILLLPWAGWLLATGDFTLAIIFAGIAAVIAGLRQWAEIRFIGKGLGMHPLLGLMGLTLGLKLFGLPGLVVGPLVISTLRTVYRFFQKEELTKIKVSVAQGRDDICTK